MNNEKQDIQIGDETFLLETATLNDLEEIYQLEQEAYPPELQASKETIQKRLDLFPETNLVLRKVDKIAAFSMGLPINRAKKLQDLEPNDEELHTPNGEAYYFRNVVVSPKFGNMGLGTTMINLNMEKARELNKKYFQFTTAPRVDEYYQKLGFQRISDYQSFHDSTEALWEKELS